MKNNESGDTYKVVVAIPRVNQQLLHNEQARRQLAGKPKQNLVELVCDLLVEKLEEVEKAG